jgi:CHAT domain-containing protein
MIRFDAARKFSNIGFFLITALMSFGVFGQPPTAIEKDRRLAEAQAAFAQGKSASAPAEALKFYQNAAELFRAAGDQNGEAKALSEAGLTAQAVGDRAAALTFFERALPLFKSVSNQSEIAKTIKNIGYMNFLAGDIKKALEKYEEAVPLFTDADALEKADTLQAVGNIYMRLTDWTKALESYNRSLPFFKTANYPVGEAETLLNIGTVYFELGQKQKALDIYLEVLSHIKKNGLKQAEAAAFINLGRAYDELGHKQKALEHFNLAYDATDNEQSRAYILLSSGKVHLDLGDKQKALENFEKSLQTLRKTGDKYTEIAALNNIGAVYSRLGEKRKAAETYSEALRLYRTLGSKRGEAATLNNLMFVWAALGNRRLAIFYGKQSVNVLQQLRAGLRTFDRESQRAFVNSVEKMYRALAELLIGEGRIAEAQEVLAMLKEEELYQFTQTRSETSPNSVRQINLNGEESEAAQSYKDLADKTGDVTRRLSALQRAQPPTPEQQAEMKNLQAELNALNERFAGLLQALNAKFAQSKTAASLDAIKGQTEIWQKRLAEFGGGDTILLTTLLTDQHYYVILTTPDAQFVRSQMISQADLNRKIVNLRELLEDPRSDPKPAAQELYQILVKPLEDDLRKIGAKTLLWSLDGALRYISPAALHDGRNFLAEKYASAVVTLAQPPDGVRAAPENWRALGAGASVGGENLPPLPQVPDELRSVVRDEKAKNPRAEKGLFAGQRLLDKEFSRANFAAALEQKNQLVHLATHFVFRPGRESDSYLLLGDGGKLNLAELRTDERMNFGGVDLLTLSACETALGDMSAGGAEIESFGVIAQRRGAKTVLASLWSIADNATPRLMEEFYRQYQAGGGQISKAEALRRAQAALLRKNKAGQNYTHPAYWGAFIVLGNF